MRHSLDRVADKMPSMIMLRRGISVSEIVIGDANTFVLSTARELQRLRQQCADLLMEKCHFLC